MKPSILCTPSTLNPVFNRFALLVGLVVACQVASRVPVAALTECPATGNTFWSFIANSPVTQATAYSTNIYLSAGSTLSVINQATGTEIDSVLFPSVTLGRPVVYLAKGGEYSELVITADNGYIYCIDPLTLAVNWSHSLLRPACATDSISAPPVVQLWENSDADFRAARNVDLIIVGTHYACSTTTANRIYGLSAANGGVLWIFNSTGTSQMDVVRGLALDYARNTVYAVSDKNSASSQNTVWALNTITGAKRWSRDVGPVNAEPGLGNEGVYVGTRSNVLYKLDLATGNTIWQQVVSNTISSSDFITRLAVDPANGRIYVLDTSGTLHAYLDECSSAASLWSFRPSGAAVTALPALLNLGRRYVYAGSSDGKVWQINGNTGQAAAWATVSSGQTAYDPLVLQEGSPTPDYRLVASAGGVLRKLCIPWPDTTGNKALLSVPGCFHLGEPAMGLAIAGDLGNVTSVIGQSVTRLLTVSNTTCYPFQCANLLGVLPPGIGVTAFSSTNNTAAWDTNSFLAQATAGLPMNLSLTVTSSIPGTYLTTVTVANGSDLHASVLLTNYVVLPALNIALNAGQVEVTWTNAAGPQLECAFNLAQPATWVTITNGITTVGNLRRYVVDASAPSRYYRLRLP